ncbi:Gfo/Idh/MocA family oxidoreductase [Alphaproteobacteria bacterium]|nr:Gfo/Idh/MocA family oxidoreductase [Alphaproteobacteria bacterium]
MVKRSFNIRIALMGCGRIAKKHAEVITGMVGRGVVLVAVCDPDVARARRFSKEYNVACYASLQSLLENEDINVVSVLTPSGMHKDCALEAIIAGKDVLVEKPVALRPEHVNELITAAATHNVSIYVVKQNRFNKPIKELSSALRDGRFGKLVLGTLRVRWCRRQEYYDHDSWRGTWAQDGGVLANQAIHHLDLLQWLMGPVDSVFAQASTALVDIEAEDTIVATLRFKSGALGVVEATNAARPFDTEGSISILGENGLVEVGGFAANELKVWNFANETPRDKTIMLNSATNPSDVYGFGHVEVYENLVKAMRREDHFLVDAVGARESIILLNAIYESVNSGRLIMPSEWQKFETVKLGL